MYELEVSYATAKQRMLRALLSVYRHASASGCEMRRDMAEI